VPALPPASVRANGGAILPSAGANDIDALLKQASLDSLVQDIAVSTPELAYVIMDRGDVHIAYGDVPEAALPETLLESELFGHDRGAFTGADRELRGRFELADGGSLSLDEIGDLPKSTQAKLLRVLQEQAFERLGGTRTIRVDVRGIAATNRDLEAMVESGEFRDDLYYRLNVVSIEIPPLRERREDIPALVDLFLRRFASADQTEVSREAMDALLKYHYPGTERVAEFERALIVEALEHSEGVQTRAARALGMSERHLRYKLTKYQLTNTPPEPPSNSG
jgi:transcriptional regulator with GAF, ATPase, and Fis domain